MCLDKQSRYLYVGHNEVKIGRCRGHIVVTVECVAEK